MTSKLRRTKIVTTLGPSTDKDNVLEEIIKAGANVVRMNFSHGTSEDHIQRAKKVRAIAARLGRQVAILGDLQGPKIRVSTFKDGKITLKVGDKFTLDSDLPKGEGNQESVGLDYKELPQDVSPNDILLLDDGRVQLQVTSVEGNKVHTRVTVGGPLSNNKGINKKAVAYQPMRSRRKTNLTSSQPQQLRSTIWPFLSHAMARTCTMPDAWPGMPA